MSFMFNFLIMFTFMKNLVQSEDCVLSHVEKLTEMINISPHVYFYFSSISNFQSIIKGRITILI